MRSPLGVEELRAAGERAWGVEPYEELGADPRAKSGWMLLAAFAFSLAIWALVGVGVRAAIGAF